MFKILVTSILLLSLNVFAEQDQAKYSAFKESPDKRKVVYDAMLKKVFDELGVQEDQKEIVKREIIEHIKFPKKYPQLVACEVELNACNEKIQNLISIEKQISNRVKRVYFDTKEIEQKLNEREETPTQTDR